MLRSAFQELESMPMDEIDHDALTEWYKRYSDGRARATVERTYTALRAMLYHAKDNGVIDQLKIIGFKFPKLTAVEKERELSNEDLAKRRMLTDEEKSGIRKGLDLYKSEIGAEHWFFPFFHIAEFSGLLPGDIYSMNWQELNINFKVIRKYPNKTKHHVNPAEVVLPLSEDILSIISQWHELLGKPEPRAPFCCGKINLREV